MPNWTVNFSTKAQKQYKKLTNNEKKPSINDTIDFLAHDLETNGPRLPQWPSFGPLGPDLFHCHLRKGKPTYVACWRILDKKTKLIEVYYVGTHEDAPY